MQSKDGIWSAERFRIPVSEQEITESLDTLESILEDVVMIEQIVHQVYRLRQFHRSVLTDL